MKRVALVGVAVATTLAVLAAGGWWYAQREAAKQIRRAMIEEDLVGRVTYGDVFYNPLTDVVTIRDIRLVGDEVPGQPHADAFQIIAWEREHDLVTRAHVKVVGLRFDAHEAARVEYERVPRVLDISFRDPASKILEHPLQALVVLGYWEVSGSAEVDFRYDPDEAQINLDIALDAQRMGALNLNIGLAGIRPSVIRAVTELGNQASSQSFLGMLGGLGALSGQRKDIELISLAAFSLSYDDAGLARRLKHYYDVHTLRVPSEPSGLEVTNGQVEEAIIFGADHGLPEEKTRSSAQAVANFSRLPGRLRLRTEIDAPIRFARLFEGEPETAVAKLILLTNAEITN